MKKIKTNQTLVALTGEVLKDGDRDVTVGLIITTVLSGQTPDPHRAYQLAKKVATEDTVELKAEDIVFIKQQLSVSKLNSILTGQVIDILDGSEK